MRHRFFKPRYKDHLSALSVDVCMNALWVVRFTILWDYRNLQNEMIIPDPKACARAHRALQKLRPHIQQEKNWREPERAAPEVKFLGRVINVKATLGAGDGTTSKDVGFKPKFRIAICPDDSASIIEITKVPSRVPRYRRQRRRRRGRGN